MILTLMNTGQVKPRNILLTGTPEGGGISESVEGNKVEVTR